MKRWISCIFITVLVFGLIGNGKINVYAKESEEINYFAYNQLSEEEQVIYQEIYQTLITVKESVQISTSSREVIDKVFQCVKNDHPEIFYDKGYEVVYYVTQNKIEKTVFKPTYKMNKSTIRQNRKAIGQYVKKCLEGIPQDAGEYEKILYFYEYIIKNTEYSSDIANGQSICSVMIDGRTVCQGYTKAFQYLCQKSGIDATMVTGYANGMSHAWNLVYAEGKPYYVDLTWGDASYITTEDNDYSGTIPPINYDYFMVTTDMLSQTHELDNVVEVPKCVNMEQNYFVKEDLFFINYDENKLRQIFTDAVESGENYVTIKCNGTTVFRMMKEHLIEKQEIFLLIPGGSTSVVFAENSLQYTLSFMLE